jgi:hypothetical protein
MSPIIGVPRWVVAGSTRSGPQDRTWIFSNPPPFFLAHGDSPEKRIRNLTLTKSKHDF